MVETKETETKEFYELKASVETLASLLDKTMKQVDRLEERLNKLEEER